MGTAHLFGADPSDVERSFCRKTADHELSEADAVCFINQDGEKLFLLASGFVFGKPKLYSFTDILGTVEYVMTLDEETMIWTVIAGEKINRPKISIHHRSALS